METKQILGIVGGVLIVVLALPFLPKLLSELKGPDPAMDGKNVTRIERAISEYKTATNYLPASLDALAPVYLDAVPRTYNGKAFLYDAKTGAVTIPAAPPVATARQPSGSGLTPMGDAMTGMSVADEMNY